MMSFYSLTTVVLRTDLRRERSANYRVRTQTTATTSLQAAETSSGSTGSGLRCYKCQDYTGRCQDVQECTYEDSCISLSERGGKTIRQCIRYTDCDNSRLSQMFPAISAFTYRCCSSNLCNSGTACTAVTPLVALLGSLLSVWWCWM
uniref:CD59 molecule (CD59 blood group) b n=1 Tax=Astatotilapia calliptera TaxID=8154 RepID=A0A3P8QTT8_ASTCA